MRKLKNMKLVIDFQGFKTENNKFIVKEFAGYDGMKVCHYIFKPPYPFEMLSPDLQKQAYWLTRNHHCIKWSDGFTPLHMFGQIIKNLTTSAECVYVKGGEKAKYIRQFITQPVLELEEQPPLLKSSAKCFFHSNDKCMCALSNVYYLYENFMMS